MKPKPRFRPTTRWRLANQRQPDIFTVVLVAFLGESILGTGYFNGAEWRSSNHESLVVTHWQPLPEPPTR